MTRKGQRIVAESVREVSTRVLRLVIVFCSTSLVFYFKRRAVFQIYVILSELHSALRWVRDSVHDMDVFCRAECIDVRRKSSVSCRRLWQNDPGTPLRLPSGYWTQDTGFFGLCLPLRCLNDSRSLSTEKMRTWKGWRDFGLRVEEIVGEDPLGCCTLLSLDKMFNKRFLKMFLSIMMS